jgi:hypothetical protein
MKRIQKQHERGVNFRNIDIKFGEEIANGGERESKKQKQI